MSEQTKPQNTTGENDETSGGTQQIVDFGSALTRTPHGSVY